MASPSVNGGYNARESTGVKSAELFSTIPAEWVIPKELMPSEEVLDVSRFPEDSGWFTSEELDITSSAPDIILQRIASRTWTARAVTAAFCKRAAAAHQLINCLTETLFPEALEAAERLDKQFAETGRTVGPLHGLPVSIKDCFKLSGRDSTLGFLSRINIPDTENSTLVDILRSLGAIIYVKTAVPIAMFTPDCNNRVFGRTVNARGRHLAVGGSSGGEGALLGFKGSPLGVGTDLAGSIRIPSAACGVFGLKPSLGRFPTGRGTAALGGQAGVTAVSGPMVNTLSGLEVFAKSVVDSEPWNKDPNVLPIPWRRVQLPTKLRFGVIWNDGMVTPTPAVRRALAKCVESLRKAGHEIIDWEAKSHKEAQDICFKFFMADGGKTVRTRLDAGNEKFPGALDFFEHATEMGVHEYWQTYIQRNRLAQEELDRWTEAGIDVLLSPSTPMSFFEHGKYKHAAYTCTWNLFNYTALSFPTNTTVDKDLDIYEDDFKPMTEVDGQIRDDYNADALHGMPMSLQIIGRRLEEEKVLAIARIVLEAQEQDN